MALDVERVVDCCMKGEKSLRRPGALETLHLVFSSSGRLMRILGSIVAPSTTFVAVRDPEIMGCGPIGPQVICDELQADFDAAA
jgi:hypothetical protein